MEPRLRMQPAASQESVGSCGRPLSVNGRAVRQLALYWIVPPSASRGIVPAETPDDGCPPPAVRWQPRIPLPCDQSLTRYAWLSIAAALVTIAMKGAAYLLTGSVGLLSDALESLVNLAGALMALAMLTVAARPADEDHPTATARPSTSRAGSRAALILIAAASIAVGGGRAAAAPEAARAGRAGAGGLGRASLINLAVALVLLRAGRRHARSRSRPTPSTC